VTTDTEGATIHYTLDDTTPTASSPVYNSPFLISNTSLLQAIAVKEGMNNSGTLSAEYTITPAAAPSADAGEDFTHDIIKDGAGFTLQGNAQNGTIAWTCAPPNGAAQPAISNPATAQPTVSGFDKLGEYTFTLTVTNGTESKSDSVKVTLVATVTTVVSFVPIGTLPGTTIDFSPNTELPKGVTYTVTDDRPTPNTWNSANGFDGKITAADYYVGVNNQVTFTQTFYLNGTKITGTNSERTVIVTAGTTATTRFISVGSDTGSVTLNEITITEGSIPPVVVSFVPMAAGATIDFSPITPLPKGVTYTVTDNSTPPKSWNSASGFNGQITASEHYTGADALQLTFTQTFYLNGVEITGTNSKRTVKTVVDDFLGVEFISFTDTGSVTLTLTKTITEILPPPVTVTTTLDIASNSFSPTPVTNLDFTPSYTNVSNPTDFTTAVINSCLTYTITVVNHDGSYTHTWNSTDANFDGKILPISEYGTDLATFTQTFYNNGQAVGTPRILTAMVADGKFEYFGEGYGANGSVPAITGITISKTK
jgi:hypothetical protein